MNEVERKEHFKEYYLLSLEDKDKDKDKDKHSSMSKDYKDKDKDKDKENVKRKRGRPKKIIPKFKITKFDEPITITW